MHSYDNISRRLKSASTKFAPDIKHLRRSFIDLFIRDQASRFTCSKYSLSHEDLTTDLQASFIIKCRQDSSFCKWRCKASPPFEGVLVSSKFKLSNRRLGEWSRARKGVLEDIFKTLTIKDDFQKPRRATKVFAVATPPPSDDIRYLKSFALHLWLLGYEFLETIMVFSDKWIHFLFSQKKASVLDVVKKRAKDVVMHIGSLEGKLEEKWVEKLTSSCLQLNDLTNGLAHVFVVKEDNELTNVRKFAHLAASEKQKKWPVSLLEDYHGTHTSTNVSSEASGSGIDKASEGRTREYITTSSKRVADVVEAVIMEKHGPDASKHPPNDFDLWEDATEGKKKGKLVGLGTRGDPRVMVTHIAATSSSSSTSNEQISDDTSVEFTQFLDVSRKKLWSDFDTKIKKIDWKKVKITDEVMEYVIPKYGKTNWLLNDSYSHIILEDIYNTFYKDEAELAKDDNGNKKVNDKRKGKMDDLVDALEKGKSKLMVSGKGTKKASVDLFLEWQFVATWPLAQKA
ncbi:transposase, Ptta/En/Spm [Tanacetum coccineum]|uniref:FACT complex subunit n=1 Tax=Tanacetum coccineum TaxID=301880 RepID=A0ABQ5HMG3_9ASTR